MSKRITITVTEETYTDLQRFMIEDGNLSVSEIARLMLTQYARHRKKNGKAPIPSKKNTVGKSKRVKEVVPLPEVICRQLGGEVKETVCHYYNYDGKSRFEMQKTLEELGENDVKKQFMPSREAVERLQSEKKVNY